MNIIGVSAFYHDSACCLVRDGLPVTAVQEERFSRVKNDRSAPCEAFAHCLEESGLTIGDIDLVAYYEDPAAKAERQAWQRASRSGSEPAAPIDPDRDLRQLRRALGYAGDIVTVTHHEAHAAHAFYLSPHESAALMVLDAVGEWSTASYWDASSDGLERLHEVRFPNSLGLAYSAVTNLLGFAVNEGEYKVMGLAAYGRADRLDVMEDLIGWEGGLDFTTSQVFIDASGGGPLAKPALAEALGVSPRSVEEDEALTQAHADIAASIQKRLEDVMVGQAACLSRRTRRTALCLAGGVALNCQAVSKIRSDAQFGNIFVPPGAGDAGGAIGAALLAHRRATGRPPRRASASRLAAPATVDSQTRRIVSEMRRLSQERLLPAGLLEDFADRENALYEAVVDALIAGELIAWCQGRTEFGPRALGNRSIIADPRRKEVAVEINARIKRREAFRPFAPAVLSERRADCFDLPEPNAFMTETAAVVSAQPLPAITHADGSARVQCVSAADAGNRFRRLLEKFEARTGCPVLLNTSLNDRGMPIAGSARDALLCFLQTGLDRLVIEDLMLVNAAAPRRWRSLASGARPETGGATPAIDTYSFF